MKHFLKQPSTGLVFYKFIDDETQDEISVDTHGEIQTVTWQNYASERISNLKQAGYIECAKQEFTDVYIDAIAKLNKITLEF